MRLHPLFDFDDSPWPSTVATLTEAERIRRRIESYNRWRRRRQNLRLRALAFGRRKDQSRGGRRLSSNLIDSPHPHASVTFGLRNLKPASSSETS